MPPNIVTLTYIVRRPGREWIDNDQPPSLQERKIRMYTHASIRNELTRRDGYNELMRGDGFYRVRTDYIRKERQEADSG